MRIRYSGDQVSEHCGHAAVSSVISGLISMDGTISTGHDEYDALVVNGGGVMHHGSRGFHQKMQEIARAQSQGRKTYLINTLWQANPSGYDSVLAGLDGMSVRGLPSQRDLASNHGMEAHRSIDLSYFAQIDENAPFADLKGAIAATDIFVEGFGFAWLAGPEQDGWHRLDMRTLSWSSLVKTLRTARLLIAGRHHAVLAACKARIPFIAIRQDSHKLADLFETARAHIPQCETRAEIANMLVWAPRNPAHYDRLFDWMETQKKPASLTEAAPPAAKPAGPVLSAYTPDGLAIMANARGANLQAGALWEQAALKSADPVKMRVNAATSYFRGGDMERGAELLFQARYDAPERPEAGQNVQFYFPIAANWLHADTVSGWQDGWAKTAEAAVAAADLKQDDRFAALAHDAIAMAEARNPAAAAAARLFIAARLIALYRQDLAWAWWNETTLSGVPEWIDKEDRFWLSKWIGLFADADKARLKDLPALPSWAKASYLRNGINDYLWTAEGAHAGLAKRAADDAAAFPLDQELFGLALKISLASGERELAQQLIAGKPAFALALGKLSAPVAEFLLAEGVTDPALPPLAALVQRARETAAAMEARLADRSRRIAVVGNSPEALGSGRGMEIDAHDEVVRFNQFKLGEKFHADYGRRTSFVFAVGHSSSLSGLYGNLPAGTTLALSTDKRLYQERHWHILANLMEQGFGICFALAEERAGLTARLGRFASTGLTFCYYLKRLRGKLDRRDFHGFSFADESTGSRYNYYSSNKGSEAHDWLSERALFDALFED
jgi:hypothetical protein